MDIANKKLANIIAKQITGTDKEKSVPVFEHMQHAYDKDAKIIKQSCLKAAASAYVGKSGESAEATAKKIIDIAELLYTWVVCPTKNSK
jgi:predicted nucleic-acid-binding Zn-ribbon protein